MSGIERSGLQDTGARLGKSTAAQDVETAATSLHDKKIISDREFDELKNGNVGPQDVAIGSAALQKLMADKQMGPMDAVKLMSTITRMNTNILSIQAAQVQADLAATKK
jgi:hypothetical protein